MDESKDGWIILLLLAVVFGGTLSCYLLGRKVERQLLTPLIANQIEQAYYEGYADATKRYKSDFVGMATPAN